MDSYSEPFPLPPPASSSPSPTGKAFIEASRRTIQEILQGKDHRKLIVVGPCSIHEQSATLDYALRLKQLSNQVEDRLFIVMRAYVEKPRTSLGWKGFIYDPDLNGSYNLLEGISQTQALLSTLTELELPLGGEILDPTTASFYTNFLSWGCIGARTSASPIHRQMASGLSFPVGFKNSVDGNVDVAIQGVVSSKQPHIFLSTQINGQLHRIHTSGNPFGHIILRGSLQGPNYSSTSIEQVVQKIKPIDILQRFLIDCSHDNSGKRPEKQPSVFAAVLEQVLKGTHAIAGMMLESFLEEGNQSTDRPLRYGVSITDACINWNTTETLITQAYHSLARQASINSSTY